MCHILYGVIRIMPVKLTVVASPKPKFTRYDSPHLKRLAVKILGYIDYNALAMTLQENAPLSLSSLYFPRSSIYS